MRFRETRPDWLTTGYGIKTPNILFAALCFVIGFLALAAALEWFGWEADAPPWAGFLIGGALFAGGAGLLSWRSGFVLDRRRGVLLRRRAVFGIGWKDAMALTDLSQVTLRCERRAKTNDSGRASSYIAYPISIEGRETSFKFADELEQDKARETARHAADTLGVVLMDLSEDVVHKDAWL